PAPKASGMKSSRAAATSSASARRWRKPAVFSGKASSGSARKLSSNPLTSSTTGHSRRSVRSFALPKRRVRKPGIGNESFSSRRSGTSSQTLDADGGLDPGAEEAAPDPDEAIRDVGDEEARRARPVTPGEPPRPEL